MDLSISLLLTTTPRCWSFAESLYANQCYKDSIYQEGHVCRKWNSRIPTHLHWTTICKCIISWSLHRLEVWSQLKCTPESHKYWPSRSCCVDHQRTSHPCKILWPGSILSLPSISQHTCQCASLLSCRTSGPMGTMHHSATTYMK